MMKKETLCKYLSEQYGSEPEYLWQKFPEYAVFRHQQGRKWFAIVINIAGEKLGLNTTETVDIVNVKARPEFIGSLLKKAGILPAYHMNKEHWISILLAGPLSDKEIGELLADSYALTASARKTSARKQQ